MGRIMRSRLIVVRLPPNEATNVAWAKEHKMPKRWRWAVRVVDERGYVGSVYGWASRLFPSYARARAAVAEYEAENGSNSSDTRGE